jgi:hypothetical protein
MSTLWLAKYTDITYLIVDDEIIRSLYDDQVSPDALETIGTIAYAVGATVRDAHIDELIRSRLGDEPDDEAERLAEWLAAETADTLFDEYEYYPLLASAETRVR